MTALLIIVGFAVALILFVILEGKRQERIYGKPSGRPNLMGVGMLELQSHLQADWRVETLEEQQKDEISAVETDPSGEPPVR